MRIGRPDAADDHRKPYSMTLRLHQRTGNGIGHLGAQAGDAAAIRRVDAVGKDYHCKVELRIDDDARASGSGVVVARLRQQVAVCAARVRPKRS